MFSFYPFSENCDLDVKTTNAILTKYVTTMLFQVNSFVFRLQDFVKIDFSSIRANFTNELEPQHQQHQQQQYQGAVDQVM